MPSLRPTESPQRELPFVRELPSSDALQQIAAATPRELKSELGQFMTPEPVAAFMAGMFQRSSGPFSILEPSAGLGALATALLDRWKTGGLGNGSARIIAHEIDQRLRPHLELVLARYRAHAVRVEVHGGDYLDHAAGAIEAGKREFTHAILNPPYKKIATTSDARLQCRRAGLETVNLYSGFVGLALAQLKPGGQLSAIVPRSFCNGPYYKPFRQFILERAAIRWIHLFDSRDQAFSADDVLQENVIILLERDAKQGKVKITTSRDARFEDLCEREVRFEDVVKPSDRDCFIHVPTTSRRDPLSTSKNVASKLSDLGITVSTGPVVDFRMREHLSSMPARGTVPLLYPMHLDGTTLRWPIEGSKKPNAISRNDETERWLFPMGTYAVVRRFSSKEERRRVVASIVAPSALPEASAIGFENHLNVFHKNKSGLSADLAWGLFAYLNSSIVDEHFRLFNGHTQVNATDLRALPYPNLKELTVLGRWAMSARNLSQADLDERVEGLLR
jgi:adenine-specific DNA-methyltransferase